MKFTKMHGIGNDYVYVNCFEESLPLEPARLSELVSDRHYGIGADGLILIRPSEAADFAMDIYNADGSRAMMCGNGIRCVAKYVYDHGLTNMSSLKIETLSGIRDVKLTVKDGAVRLVSVDMGVPVLLSNGIQLELLPGTSSGLSREQIWEELDVPGGSRKMIAVSMGNPHAVFFMKSFEDFDITFAGPAIERHRRFPDRTNVEFIQMLDRENIRMRVWERGSGETMACGTGACAAAVASMLAGFTGREVNVKLLGGTLSISYDGETGHVIMTGPATEVFQGDFKV